MSAPYDTVSYQDGPYERAEDVERAAPPAGENGDGNVFQKEYRFSMYNPELYTTYVSGGSMQSLARTLHIVDVESRKAFSVFFGLLRFIIDPILNLYLEAVALAMHIFNKAGMETLSNFFENFFKPIWHMIYHFLMIPLFTILHQIFLVLLRMDSLHRVLNAIVDAICRIFASLRFVQVHNHGPVTEALKTE